LAIDLAFERIDGVLVEARGMRLAQRLTGGVAPVGSHLGPGEVKNQERGRIDGNGFGQILERGIRPAHRQVNESSSVERLGIRAIQRDDPIDEVKSLDRLFVFNDPRKS
jgi:hypothetical protein